MAKKNSLDLSGLDLSGLDLSGLNDKKEKPSLDLSGLDLSGLDLSVLDKEEEEVKKKSQAEPTPSDSSDGELLSKEVEPTPERKELTEEELRLKGAETANIFGDTFTPMEDPNAPMPSEERMSNIDIPLKQKQEDLEKSDKYYKTPEYTTGLDKDINKIESEDLKYVDYLSIIDPEEYVENNLNLEDYNFADSKVVVDIIKNKKKDALKKIGLDQGDKTRENYATEIKDSDKSFTPEDITEMVDSTELSDVKKFGVNRLRLDEDQEKEYKEDILELSALKENKNKTTEEKLLQFSLSKKVAKLRENQDKQFINPETGEIDGAVKKEVTDKAKVYSKVLKTDYQKFLDKYKEEYHNIKGIEEEMKILTKSETPPSRYIIENYAYANLREAVSEDRPGFQPKIGDKSVAVEKLKNKLLFLYDGLAKSEKNFMALNRALLLNEDPAAVSRGFKMLEGIPILQGAGEILTSAGESLAETVTGEDIVTDKDYANTIVQLANETGVKLTEEQYDRGKEDFEEKLGGAVGTSIPMMAEIAFNVLVTKNIGAALKIPSYLSKLKKLKDSPKLASFVGKAMEATTQAIAFEFAEGGSLAMGAGEYYGGRLGEKIVSAITKGKGGKFLSLFGKVVGAGSAGTVEEYAGEFIDEGFKQGFFTKEQFETTFGRTYDEALDKFLITAVMATAMGGAAEVGSVLADAENYYKNLGDTERLTELEELIEANKESSSSESKGEGKDLELKVDERKPIGDEELTPFTEEVDEEGKTFLTTEGETQTEEAIEEEITEPTQEQIQEDIANKDFATFKYEDESSVPKELKKYISSKGSTQVGIGSSKKKSVNVTVPKSLANYLNSKAEASNQESSEITTDTTTEGLESKAKKELEDKVEKNRLEKVESELEEGNSLEESESTAKIEAEEELAEGLKEIKKKAEKEEVDKVKQELEDIKSELESKPASDRTLQDKIILDSIKKKGLTSVQKKSLIKNYKTSKKGIKKEIREQTGQTDISDKIQMSEKQLLKKIYKGQEKATKELKSSEKKAVVEVFKKVEALAGERVGKDKTSLKGKVSFKEVKKLQKELAGLDPTNQEQVSAFEHKIDQLVKDSEFEVKKQEAIKIKKQLQKIGKKRKGVRGKYAAELNDIDLNKVESIDAFLETAKSLLGSFKGAIKKDNEITITETDPGIVTQLEETIKTLKEEQAKYEELLGERREIKRLEDAEKSDIEITEEYEESGLKDVMTLEEYEQFRESSPEEAAKAIPEKSKKELALRKAVSERIDNLKGWLKDNEKTLTQGQKRKINDIINNKELINDDATNMADVIDTFNALEEILSFDSTAGITRITSKLEGLQLGKKILKDFIGKFNDWSVIGIDFKTMNQSTYLKAISDSLDTAKELSSVLLVNIKKAKVKAKKLSDSFNIKVDKLAKKLKIDQELSVKLGVYSRLKQNEEGLTQEEIDEDFALKIESIKNEIIELKKKNKRTQEDASNERKAKVLEEVYSKIKDAKSYSEIESNLSENESKMLAFLEESFAKIRPDLENTYLENQGKDMEGVSFYIPTVVSNKRDGSTQTGDLKNNLSRESLDRETSGRTIKRSKTDPTGKTQYNYDIVEVAKFGMKQSLFDINVLYDSQVLANTISSKDFKEAIGDEKVLKDLKEKLANTYSPNYFAIDRTEQNKITRALNDYVKSFVVQPLKTIFQYAKQPISIMGATATRVNLKSTVRSYGIISNSIVSKKYRKKLDKFLENSTVSIRTVEGDIDIASSDPLYIKFLNMISGKLPGKYGKIAGKTTAFTKKYISDALSLSDDVAAKGSFLSFYINEKMKKDPNYVFDLDKEIANPDMKAVGKADVEADWVNNNSDVDESGTFLKDNSTIKSMLFLFKSFAVNQSINFLLDSRNITSSKRTGKVEASRALAGTMLGGFMFEGMRQALKIGSEKMLSSVLDDMGEEEKKEVSDEIGFILGKSLYNSLFDVVAGGLPSDVTHYFKVGVNYANWMLVYKDENEERKEMGEELIKKRDKDPFFINDSPGGIIGLAESYITAGYKSIDVLIDEYSTEEMEFIATCNLIMMLLQDENLRRPTSKAVNKYKKINKAEEKEFEKRFKRRTRRKRPER